MHERRTATLHDVARRAGVGKSTVSNVLSGTGRASAATRERVLAAAGELGYTPNRAARRLRGKRTGTVGVYVPGVPSMSEYYMRFVFGVMEYLALRGADTVILSGGDRRPLPALDGVIVSDPDETDPAAIALLESGLPSVGFERPYGPTIPPPDVVLWCDHAAATSALLDHMHRSGTRRPALMISPETNDWAAQLGGAYRDWCVRSGADPVVTYIDWVPTAKQIDEATAALLEQHPGVDGLICGAVDVAPAALPALRRHGRVVGDDFLLATGTESTAARLGQPPITAIDLDPLAAGRRCAELLDGLLADGPADPSRADGHAADDADDADDAGAASADGADRPVELQHPLRLRLRRSTRGDGELTVPVPPRPAHPLR